MPKKPSNPDNWNAATLAVHGRSRQPKPYYAVSTPIVHTSNFYFDTAQEVEDFMRAKGQGMIDQNVRVSGAVVNSSTKFEVRDNQPYLEFEIADADRVGAQTPLRIVYNGPKPDLIEEPQAQAIVEGHLGADGNFHADNLLLKCPSRYEEEFPNQVDKTSG